MWCEGWKRGWLGVGQVPELGAQLGRLETRPTASVESPDRVASTQDRDSYEPMPVSENEAWQIPAAFLNA